MSQENVQIVRDIHAAMARRDEDAIFARYRDDIEWHDHVWIDVGTRHGHAGIRSVWGQFLAEFEIARFEGREFLERGDRVVVDTVITARGRSSGIAVDQEICSVWTLGHDGLVVRVDIYRDLAAGFDAVDGT